MNDTLGRPSLCLPSSLAQRDYSATIPTSIGNIFKTDENPISEDNFEKFL